LHTAESAARCRGVALLHKHSSTPCGNCCCMRCCGAACGPSAMSSLLKSPLRPLQVDEGQHGCKHGCEQTRVLLVGVQCTVVTAAAAPIGHRPGSSTYSYRYL
jgi:hypothetical protein